jgi:hypothetical protein
MEALNYSETLIQIYWTTRDNNLENGNLHIYKILGPNLPYSYFSYDVRGAHINISKI